MRFNAVLPYPVVLCKNQALMTKTKSVRLEGSHTSETNPDTVRALGIEISVSLSGLTLWVPPYHAFPCGMQFVCNFWLPWSEDPDYAQDKDTTVFVKGG